MSKAVALDPGTMFFQVAERNENGHTDIRVVRNAFVEMPGSEDVEDILEQNDWMYVKDGNKFYVIGEDSIRVANMFPDKVELRRPMQDGVLNKNEDKKMVIMAQLVESVLGQAPDKKSICCACVSSESVDQSSDSRFHKARLEGMIKRLGWNVDIIEEGLAIIFSEKPVMMDVDDEGQAFESPYTGIGISFGAGRVNCVLANKGWLVIGMSAARSGDWIDKMVSETTGTPIPQVTRKKERELDFENIDFDDDVVFALNAYYGEMIKFVFEKFSAKFQAVKSQFESPLEVVVAGGTSMPKGFSQKVAEVVEGLELPFEIKEVRHAKDPRNSVVRGCLAKAMLTQKKQNKEKGDDDIGDLVGEK